MGILFSGITEEKHREQEEWSIQWMRYTLRQLHSRWFREIKAVSRLNFSNVKNSCPALESVTKLPHTLASHGVKLGQNECILLLGDAPDSVQHNVSSDSAEHLFQWNQRISISKNIF
jgi:hypothetical protein